MTTRRLYTFFLIPTLVFFCISLILFFAYFGFNKYSAFTWITWLLSIAVLLAFPVVLQREKLPVQLWTEVPSYFRRLFQEKYVEILGLLVLICFTVVFRWTNIENYVWGYRGITLDTSYLGEIAFRIVDGQVGFSPVQQSVAYHKDSLQAYYLALFFLIFGKTMFALRLSALVVSIINVLLLYWLCQMLFQKSWLSFWIALLYACSATDTIFTYSSFEQTTSTPLFMLSFILLDKAVRENNSILYTLSGLTIGLGLFSSFYFIALSPVLFVYLVYVLIQQRGEIGKHRLGLGLFAGMIVVVIMPKIIYLLFNSYNYVARIYNVSSVRKGTNLSQMIDQFRIRFSDMLVLLFQQTPNVKVLLGPAPIVDPWIKPFMLLSLIILVMRFWKPYNLFLLGIVGQTVLVDLLSYTVDYRFIVTVPFLYAISGYVVSLAGKILPERLLQILALGLVFPIVVSNYQAYRDSNTIMYERPDYHAKETDVVRLANDRYKGKTVYYSIADPTYTADFFAAGNPESHLHSILNVYLPINECFPDSLYELHSKLYTILKENLTRINNLVLIFDDSVCNRKLIAFLEKQLYFTRRDFLVDVQSKMPLIVLENLRIFEPEREAKKLFKTKTVPFKAQQISIRKEWIGGILAVYKNTDLPTMVRRFDPEINFDWGSASPDPTIVPEHFSVDWQGYIRIPESGPYTFILESDDGSRLWIDETLVVDAWSGHPPIEAQGEIKLEKGWHMIAVRYYENVVTASIKLSWIRNGKKEIVPSENLCCKAEVGLPAQQKSPAELPLFDYILTGGDQSHGDQLHEGQLQPVRVADLLVNGVRGRYYSKANWTGESKPSGQEIQIGDSLEGRWDYQPGPNRKPWEPFSLRLNGEMNVKKAGVYRFTLTSDDGSLLYLDGSLVLDNGGEKPRIEDMKKSADLLLKPGRHAFRLDYFDVAGQAILKLDVQFVRAPQ